MRILTLASTRAESATAGLAQTTDSMLLERVKNLLEPGPNDNWDWYPSQPPAPRAGAGTRARALIRGVMRLALTGCVRRTRVCRATMRDGEIERRYGNGKKMLTAEQMKKHKEWLARAKQEEKDYTPWK
jgi:hypothetical protein